MLFRSGAPVVGARRAFGEAESFESLDRSGDRRWFDAEGVGEFAHTPRRALGEQVERVHLALLDRLVARAVEPVAHLRTGCAATDFAPGAADADGEVVQLLLTLGAEGLGHGGG